MTKIILCKLLYQNDEYQSLDDYCHVSETKYKTNRQINGSQLGGLEIKFDMIKKRKQKKEEQTRKKRVNIEQISASNAIMIKKGYNLSK